MTYLILADEEDRSAIRVAASLRRRHPAAEVRLVSAAELVLAPRWAHSPGEIGTGNEVELHDGTVLRPAEIGVVLNRLQMLPMPHFAANCPADVEYGAMETFALALSWLRSFPGPVVNAASPQGLSGARRSKLAWTMLAARAGLPVAPVVLRSSGSAPETGETDAGWPVVSVSPPQHSSNLATCSVLIAGDSITGGIPENLRKPALAFARAAGAEILRITLRSSPQTGSGWVFASADLHPELNHAKEIAGVVALLEAQALVPVGGAR